MSKSGIFSILSPRQKGDGSMAYDLKQIEMELMYFLYVAAAVACVAYSAYVLW